MVPSKKLFINAINYIASQLIQWSRIIVIDNAVDEESSLIKTLGQLVHKKLVTISNKKNGSYNNHFNNY